MPYNHGPKLLPLEGDKYARMYSPNYGVEVCRVMKIGDLFKNLAGKSPGEFKDPIGIEHAAQAALGYAINIEPFESELVPKCQAPGDY